MEKFTGSAEEARKITKTTGENWFNNLVYRHIKRAAEEGCNCIYHTYGNEYSQHVDNKIVESVSKELIAKGYLVTDILDDEDSNPIGVLKIEW